MRIQVKDFMSSPVTIAVGKKSVKEIRAIMNRDKIHAIPIIEYLRQLPDIRVAIKGIVTSSDLSKDVDENLAIEEFMTSNVHVIHKDSSAGAAAKMMLKHKVHHIVVMEDGKIIGIISSLDFVKLVAEHTLD
jgi:CBS domain-containing protein